MAFSYSFHLSAKSHAVSNTGKVASVSKHNLRAYQSNNYDKGLINVLEGSKTNIMDDIAKIYAEEFKEPLKAYNERVRADRQIDDYLKHVSDSRSDVAAEIIIQVGDRDFWADKTAADKRVMDEIFQKQLDHLKQECPNFKIASAVIHYDESSPHMHVVGVPIADGYKKGLEKQVAKTKVFTQESLSTLQDTMRNNVTELIRSKEVFADVQLKDKEKGRNKDIPKESLDEFYSLQEQNKELAAEQQEATQELDRINDMRKYFKGQKSEHEYGQKDADGNFQKADTLVDIQNKLHEEQARLNQLEDQELQIKAYVKKQAYGSTTYKSFCDDWAIEPQNLTRHDVEIITDGIEMRYLSIDDLPIKAQIEVANQLTNEIKLLNNRRLKLANENLQKGIDNIDFKEIMNSALTNNLVLEVQSKTIEQLYEANVLKCSPFEAQFKVNHKSIIQELKDTISNFIDKVKEHAQQLFERNFDDYTR